MVIRQELTQPAPGRTLVGAAAGAQQNVHRLIKGMRCIIGRELVRFGVLSSTCRTEGHHLQGLPKYGAILVVLAIQAPQLWKWFCDGSRQ